MDQWEILGGNTMSVYCNLCRSVIESPNPSKESMELFKKCRCVRAGIVRDAKKRRRKMFDEMFKKTKLKKRRKK